MVQTRRQARECKEQSQTSESNSDKEFGKEIVLQISRSARKAPRRSGRLVSKRTVRYLKDGILIEPKKEPDADVPEEESSEVSQREALGEKEKLKVESNVCSDADSHHHNNTLSRTIENGQLADKLWRMNVYSSESVSSNYSSGTDSSDEDGSDDHVEDAQSDCDEKHENQENKNVTGVDVNSSSEIETLQIPSTLASAVDPKEEYAVKRVLQDGFGEAVELSERLEEAHGRTLQAQESEGDTDIEDSADSEQDEEEATATTDDDVRKEGAPNDAREIEIMTTGSEGESESTDAAIRTDESEGEITDDISDCDTDTTLGDESEIDSIVPGINRVSIGKSTEEMDMVNEDFSETVGDSEEYSDAQIANNDAKTIWGEVEEASDYGDTSATDASDKSEYTLVHVLDRNTDDEGQRRRIGFMNSQDTSGTDASDTSEYNLVHILDRMTDDEEEIIVESMNAQDVSTIAGSSSADSYSSDPYDSDSFSDSPSTSESGIYDGVVESDLSDTSGRSEGSSEKSGDSPRTRARKRSRKFPSLSGTFNFDDYNPKTREVDPGFEMPKDLTRLPPINNISDAGIAKDRKEDANTERQESRPKERRLTWSDPLEYIRQISPRIRHIFGT